MTELKTLKDLKFENKELVHAGWLIWHHELRAVAIKWIKKWRTEILELDTTNFDSEPYLMKTAKIAWAKYFFNITDEDLK